MDILGRSVEELESTVYALESQVCALSEIQLFPSAFLIFHVASKKCATYANTDLHLGGL